MDNFFLNIKQVAEKLKVSEKTIYRMLDDHQIPFAVKIGGQWRFRETEIEEWIDLYRNPNRKKKISYDLSIHEALSNGTILYNIQGGDRDQVLNDIFSAIPRPVVDQLNTEAMKNSILARESIISSSMNGTSFMMPSYKKPVYIDRTMIILCFPARPVFLDAIDGIKTRTIFLLLPANHTEMRVIDVKLRRLSLEQDFYTVIKQDNSRKVILDYLQKKETMVFKTQALKDKEQR